MNELEMINAETICQIAGENSDGLLKFDQVYLIAKLHKLSPYQAMVDLGNGFSDPEVFASWLGYN